MAEQAQTSVSFSEHLGALLREPQTHEPQSAVLEEWLTVFQREIQAERLDEELREDGEELLGALARAAAGGEEEWEALLSSTRDLTRARLVRVLTPGQATRFLGSLRNVLLRRSAEAGSPAEALEHSFSMSRFFDHVSATLMTAYVEARDEIILRQQEDLLELSTPAIMLWDGIVAMPLVGTLDSRRALVVMESLLGKLAESGASVAILDITGVPMVDTMVAQHLLKTVAATRLMGARCILCGIRPQIAQTMVELGIALEEVVTCATLADAFARALSYRELRVEAAR